MKKVYFITFSIALIIGVFVSCNKLFPFAFSDSNDVVSFAIHKNATPKVVINQIIVNPNVAQDEGIITIVVDSGSSYFPLVFNADIKISPKATINNWREGLMIAFEDTTIIKKFYVVSESGIVKTWSIKISDHTPLPPTKIDPAKQNTNILSFGYGDIKPDKIIGAITIKDSLLLTYDDAQLPTFPFLFTPVIQLPNDAFFPSYTVGTPVVLNTKEDIFPLVVMAADRITTKTYYIGLKPLTIKQDGSSSDADITDFTIKTISSLQVPQNMKGIVDPATNSIYVVVYNDYNFASPVKLITASVTTSPKSTILGFKNLLTFNSINNDQTLIVVAENGIQKSWKVKLLYSPQIPNSGFEIWNLQSRNPANSSKDLPNLNGGGWCGTNFDPNSSAKGVVVGMEQDATDFFEGTKSVKLTTQYVYVDAKVLGIGATTYTPVSGAMVFLGKFNFVNSEATLQYPSLNYTFGIPFSATPQYMHVAFKYTPGATPVINANYKGITTVVGNAVPVFDPLKVRDGGTDFCDIWIQIYSNDTKIGEGRFSTNKTYTAWQEVYIPIIYNNPSGLTPNKIDIRCSSSKESLIGPYIGSSGLTEANIVDYPNNMPFKGQTNVNESTKGSVLKVDDIFLIYTPNTITYHPISSELQ